MHSCIYTGIVRHRRFSPAANTFRYRIFQMYLDLAELPQLFSRYPGWSASGPALAWFRRADHLGPASEPLDECVRNEVCRQTGVRPDGPIRLLTHLRYFGIGMNPVSFFYCFDAADSSVTAVLAEVNNTPWGERHLYVLSNPCSSTSGAARTLWNAKQFHVSPFMPMQMNYCWRISLPGERLSVHIQNHPRPDASMPIHAPYDDFETRAERPAERSERATNSTSASRPFDVTLSLKRVPITGASLTHVLLHHPCMTLKVLGAIYWQAFRLWKKGVPFVPHPHSRSASGCRTDIHMTVQS